VLNRRRIPRTTISSGKPASLNDLTPEQIDTEIRLRSRTGKGARLDCLIKQDVQADEWQSYFNDQPHHPPR
jgi:hypothetical protein